MLLFLCWCCFLWSSVYANGLPLESSLKPSSEPRIASASYCPWKHGRHNNWHSHSLQPCFYNLGDFVGKLVRGGRVVVGCHREVVCFAELLCCFADLLRPVLSFVRVYDVNQTIDLTGKVNWLTFQFPCHVSWYPVAFVEAIAFVDTIQRGKNKQRGSTIPSDQSPTCSTFTVVLNKQTPCLVSKLDRRIDYRETH